MAKLLLILLEIVIGLALVGTVATSTTSGSTALASFTNAQALVIIIPLIFVALILFGAYQHFEHKRTRGGILAFAFVAFEPRIRIFLVLLQTRATRAFLWAAAVFPGR